MPRSRPRSPGRLPPPDVAPRGADLTREKLLQATHELLFERSGDVPSVSAICERADVRVAMVSYCFGGKAGLLEALIDRSVTGMMAEQERLIALRLSAEEALARHIHAIVRNFVRFPYLNSLGERLVAGDPAAVRMGRSFVAPTIAWYAELLAEGDFREVDPTLLLFSIVGMCEFLFAAKSWLADADARLDDALVERYAEHVVALTLRGLRAEG